METTITLQQQREMLTNAIAQFKAKGKAIEIENAQHDLRRFDEARTTGLKYKNLDGEIYETFSWYYIASNGGKKWNHSYVCETKWGVIITNVRKNRCFK